MSGQFAYPPDREEDITVVRRGVTGADGRFRIELPPADSRPDEGISIVMTADGYGVYWIDLP